MQPYAFARPSRWMLPLVAGAVIAGAIATTLYWRSASARVAQAAETVRARRANSEPSPRGGESATMAAKAVAMSRAQQEAIKLTVVPAVLGVATEEIDAPGQIVPDESRFAYITPRAAGVVRTVAARLGQEVKAGALLAMIDSPEVAKARFDLYTAQQDLEIARTQAAWQKNAYENTQELVERLREGDTPEQIHRRFQGRQIGDNRDKLLTAYADFRLKDYERKRNEELIKSKVITSKQFQQVTADYEMAQATYQGLMDQMEYNNKLAFTRTRQTLQLAETSLRVARERLRVLGVPADGTEPEIKDGMVVGVRPDGSLPVDPDDRAGRAKSESILPRDGPDEIKPVGSPDGTGAEGRELPVSTYAIWAPFDGTLLDRDLIVPGVFVDTTHRIFTLSDLSNVCVEVAIHESRYGALSRSQDADLLLSSPAYPDRKFAAEVTYTGDLVDPKSRTIKLLARAKNPDRMLKPGMFVEVTLRLKGAKPAILIPEAALLTDDDRALIFVQLDPERFERRQVVAGTSADGKVAILKGLAPGEKVVVDGAFALKAKAMQAASE